MFAIRPLSGIGLDNLLELNTGYITTEHYRVQKSDNPARLTFDLQLERLPAPVHKHW